MLLPKLAAHSIDMILCDLPYGITQNKWDSIIPLDLLWEQYRRVLKPDGVCVLTASQPFTSQLVCSSPASWFRYEWIWHKNCVTGHLNVKRMPMEAHENILVFSPALHTYVPQGLQPYGKIKKRGHNGANYGKSGTENFQEVTGYPRSVLEFDSDRSKLHPTIKPVALFEYLLRTYTDPDGGGWVLDNCCGSGTTGVACENTGRNFIEMDIDPEYCTVAYSRLADTSDVTLTVAESA
jgi:site-specific DNA-methyltransferase (adenine-specific)